MYVLIFLAVVALIVGMKSVRIVPSQMRYVILRLGKFYRVAGPGLTVVVPLFDTIGAKFSMNEQEMLFDNVLIRYRVLEPRKAFEGAADMNTLLTQAAQTAMRTKNNDSLAENMNRLVHHLGVHIVGADTRRFK